MKIVYRLVFGFFSLIFLSLIIGYVNFNEFEKSREMSDAILLLAPLAKNVQYMAHDTNAYLLGHSEHRQEFDEHIFDYKNLIFEFKLHEHDYVQLDEKKLMDIIDRVYINYEEKALEMFELYDQQIEKLAETNRSGDNLDQNLKNLISIHNEEIISAIQNKNLEEISNVSKTLQYLTIMAKNVQYMAHDTNAYLLGQSEHRQEFDKHISSFDKAWDGFMVHQGQHGIVQSSELPLTDAIDSNREIFVNDAFALFELFVKTNEKWEEVDKLGDENDDAVSELLIIHNEELIKIQDESIIIISTSLIILLIVGIIIASSVSNSIRKPIKTLQTIMYSISCGDLETNIPRPKKDEIGNLMKSLVIMQESLKESKILERRNLEIEKVKVKNERLIAIGELSARIAHDIKNPLTSLQNSVKIIEKKIAADDELTNKEIQRMGKAIKRIVHQVDQVLNFVKSTPLDIDKNSLLEILNFSLESINLTKNITVTIPKNDYTIECDEVKLGIVFYNILLNAVQAIGSDSGTITIKMSGEQDNIKIEFKNSGPNIDEKNTDKIFEPLFTTKMEGTGLGLSSCKTIIQEHHGTISVSSNPVIFTILLPKTLKF